MCCDPARIGTQNRGHQRPLAAADIDNSFATRKIKGLQYCGLEDCRHFGHGLIEYLTKTLK